jgi:membrane fusion protein, multidrug efflux system
MLRGLCKRHYTATLLVTCALLAACQPAEDEATAPSAPFIPTVTTFRLTPVSWQGQVTSFGVIEALEEVDIAAELSGTVSRVHVDEGDRVSAGQLLLELDPEKSELALQQADKVLAQARAELEDARQKLERRSNLAAGNTISKEALDTAQVTLDAAIARYQQAIAAHQLAQRQLADTRITSPGSGVVDVQAVEAGESVQAGASLITLQAVDGLRMQTWVSEADILMLNAGSPASISVSVLPGKAYPAVIEWLGVTADRQTGNYPVKLLLDNRENLLRPGMTATVSMQASEVKDALILPEKALVDRGRRRVVFVVEDGRAQLREPVLAAGLANRLHVIAGLEENDLLVVAGHERIVDGSQVTLTSEQ